MRQTVIILVIGLAVLSCTPPPVTTEEGIADFRQLMSMRAEEFSTAAYLIDMRINDGGRKYSVMTEVYFSGDSVGIYGRAYLGKGAFRGNVIDKIVTVYFPQVDEYFSGPLADMGAGSECAGPGEVLVYMLSLMSGKAGRMPEGDGLIIDGRERIFREGRFERRMRVNRNQYPRREGLYDPVCGDTIMIDYDSFDDKFPYYKPKEIYYRNRDNNFRAKGYVREQRYNITIKPKKFIVEIPVTARRLESI